MMKNFELNGNVLNSYDNRFIVKTTDDLQIYNNFQNFTIKRNSFAKLTKINFLAK